MKKKRNLWTKIVCVIALLVSLTAFPVSAEDLSAYTLEGIGHSADALGGTGLIAQEYDRSGVGFYSAQSVGWSYGSQLSGNALQIYNTMVKGDLAHSTKDRPVWVKFNTPYTAANETALKNAQNVLRRDIEKAEDAYLRDYGEYFWVETFYFSSTPEYYGTGYAHMKLMLYSGDYYSACRSEAADVERELQKAIQYVNGFSGTYNKVRAAHDWVITHMEYTPSAKNGGSTTKKDHTLTGGLLAKYRNEGVCEGYAKIFQQICNRCGISCILVSGGEKISATKVENDHMWNYVRMDDGLWYLIDCTWDDMGKSSSKEVSTSFFLTKGDYRHTPVGQINYTDYVPFYVPRLASKNYQSSAAVGTTTGVTLQNTTLTLDVDQGDYVYIDDYSASYNSGNAFSYTSSNSSIATVNANGYIVGKKAGTANITVRSKTNTNVYATCKVTVRDHAFDTGAIITDSTTTATGVMIYTCTHNCGAFRKAVIPKKYVKLSYNTLPLQVKKSTTALKVTGYQSPDAIIGWSSSAPKIVTVNGSGKLTAKKKGTATITVRMRSGAKATCRVTVQKGAVKTTSLKPGKTVVELKKGQTYTISYSRQPVTANDKVTFSSSAKKIATVSSKGKVKAKKPGTANITIKAGGKKKAVVQVVVR